MSVTLLVLGALCELFASLLWLFSNMNLQGFGRNFYNDPVGRRRELGRLSSFYETLIINICISLVRNEKMTEGFLFSGCDEITRVKVERETFLRRKIFYCVMLGFIFFIVGSLSQ